MSMAILLFAPASRGGIADYTHHQANAMADRGADVTVLCTPRYPTGRGERYRVVPRLRELAQAVPSGSRWRRRLHFVAAVLYNFKELARFVRASGSTTVLLDSYFEYMAPLWAWRLRRLARRGMIFGANVHDPVRDYVVGPRWWHRWSIAQGYSFLREAFVHHAVELETGRARDAVRTTVVPQGIYEAAAPRLTRAEARREWGLDESTPVALLFGSIRDNKNLDLILEALAEVPRWHLVVAGDTISASARPVAYYQELAARLGVASRCHWRVGFVPAAALGDLFVACDLVLLTYGASFHSHSAVLNTAAWYRKPSLASSGEGALEAAVRDYQLGIFVTPDSAAAIAKGFRQWEGGEVTPHWTEYLADHSWDRNAALVLGALGVSEASQPLSSEARAVPSASAAGQG